MILKRFSSLIVGSLFLMIAVALWAMPMKSQPTARVAEITAVTTAPVRMVNTQRTARFSGVTRAKNRAVLSFTVPARVVERRIDTGATVRKGDILARLDDQEFSYAVQLAQASVAQLTAQLRQAAKDRFRLEPLAAADVIPVSDLEQAVTREEALKAALDAATARRNEASRRLKETVLKAPFSGTVTKVHLQPGEWAVPGHPAIELTGNSDVELLVEVPESVVARLTEGQSVEVQLPFAGYRTVPGQIRTVANAALAAGRLFPVIVDLIPEAGLTAGMTAQLLVQLATEGVLTVPLVAVVNPGASQPHVFVHEDGRAFKRNISLGRIINGRISVNGLLSNGDQVITSGQSLLADGDQVEVVQ